MTGEEDNKESRDLPLELLIRLQLQAKGISNVTKDDLDLLTSYLATDPRIEFFLLQRLAFSVKYEEGWDDRLLSPLIEQRKALGSLRLLLRSAACRSVSKRGGCNLAAMDCLDELGEGDRVRTWFFLKAVGMPHYDLGWREEHVGTYISSRSFDWLYERASDHPEWIPLLFADGKRPRTKRKELLNILARQTEEFLQDYDLGELSAPLQELRQLLREASVSGAKSQLFESRLDAEKASPFPRTDFSAEEVDGLIQTAEADQWSWWDALESLCRISDQNPEVKEWLAAQLGRTGSSVGSWASVIARHTRDHDLALTALKHTLEEPGQRDGLDYLVGRFCKGPWKLPAKEGVGFIRGALAVRYLNKSGEEQTRGDLWYLMISEYGDQVRDFSDLLLEVENGCFAGWKAGMLLWALYERGIHRDEIRRLVERHFQLPMESGVHPKDRLMSLDWLETVESPIAWSLWTKIAEQWPEAGTRAGAMTILAQKGGTRPEFLELLRRMAHDAEDRVRSQARLLLEICSPRDFRAAGFGSSSQPSVSEGFDLEGFRRWNEKADERRYRWMSELADHMGNWDREDYAYALAYWFGDHPDTLSFLIGYVQLPTGLAVRNEGESGTTSGTDTWAGEPGWEREPDVRKHCLQVLGWRWPADERVHEVAKWALDHPWKPLRGEAARIIARDYTSSPDTPELLARQMGSSDVVFEEYVALMHRDLGAMRKALDVLASLDHSACDYLVSYGPRFLARAYGPRKDLKAALEKIAAETEVRALRESIGLLFEKFW